MAKTINVDFFKLSISQAGDSTFEDAYNLVSQLPKEEKIMFIDKIPLWLHSHRTTEQYIQGDMVRLRMDNLPAKGKLSGTIENLDLEDDEGISEQSAFFYSKSTNVLLLQKVVGGVDIGRFCKYFSEISEFSGTIIAEPILEADAMRKFKNFKEIREFEIKIASLESLEIYKDIDPSVEEILELNSELNSSTISVTFSAERKKENHISIKRAMDIAKSLLKIHGHESSKVRKVNAMGISDTDESIYLDLLGTRMREKIDISFSGSQRNRDIPYAIRIDAIKKAWTKKQEELVKMFKA